MPEVVYATPDANGKARNWDDVFPIWKNDKDEREWRVVNSILEAIAMNNRYGGRDRDEMKAYLKEQAYRNTVEFIEQTGTEDLEERKTIFLSYGLYVFYIDQVYENLGGAYREYKS